MAALIEVNKELAKAGIPAHCWDKKLSDHPSGNGLSAYVLGERFKEERHTSVGVNAWSPDATKRVQVFPLLVRSLVFMHVVPVRTVSLLTLCDAILSDDHPIYLEILIGALAVQGFCDSSKDFPFTGIERFRIEHFLMTRSDTGHPNYYCSQGSLSELNVWWSDNFIAHQQQFVRDIEIA
jgi:hypothetical protein